MRCTGFRFGRRTGFTSPLLLFASCRGTSDALARASDSCLENLDANERGEWTFAGVDGLGGSEADAGGGGGGGREGGGGVRLRSGTPPGPGVTRGDIGLEDSARRGDGDLGA